jgi:hypothetical protein
VAKTAFADVGRASAVRDQVFGVRRASPCGGGDGDRDLSGFSATVLPGGQFVSCWAQGVEQRLVADRGAAAFLDSPDRCIQHRHDARRVDGFAGTGRHACAQERGAPYGSRRPSQPAGQGRCDLSKERCGVRRVERFPLVENRLEATRERVAEVAVAGRGVEFAEVLLVLDRGVGHDAHRFAQSVHVAHRGPPECERDLLKSMSRSSTSRSMRSEIPLFSGSHRTTAGWASSPRHVTTAALPVKSSSTV